MEADDLSKQAIKLMSEIEEEIWEDCLGSRLDEGVDSYDAECWISKEHLKNVFKFKDDGFLHKVIVVLGDSFFNAVYIYKINANIASLFLARCLKLSCKEEAFWIVLQCVREEWCWGLVPFMAIARPGEGFVASCEARVRCEELEAALQSGEGKQEKPKRKRGCPPSSKIAKKLKTVEVVKASSSSVKRVVTDASTVRFH
ncbi:hypothetical protein SUGI_0606900 [Cryptomeria japonica]|nr:hypothetical protein SUGI_0606900 [Cryptomeria japonica]